MIESLFFGILYFAAWICSHALLWRLGSSIVTIFAFAFCPVLLATLGLLSAEFHLGTDWRVLIAGSAMLGSLVWLTLHPRPLRVTDLPWLVGGTLCSGAIALFSTLNDFYYLSTDGFTYLMLGTAIGEHGGMLPVVRTELLDRGILPVLLQAFAKGAGQDYFVAQGPLAALGLTLSWCALTSRFLGKPRWAPLAVGSVFLLTTPLVILQASTIHTNLMTAIFFLWYWGSVWRFVDENETQWLNAAVIALLGILFCRPEAPLIVGLFLGLTLALPLPSVRPVLPRVFAFSILLVGWFLWFGAFFQARFDPILTPSRLALSLAPIFLLIPIFVWRSRNEERAGFTRRMALLVFAAAACLFAFVVFKRPMVVYSSAICVQLNLGLTGRWGYSIWGLLLVAGLTAFLPRWKWQQSAQLVMVTYVLLVFSLLLFRPQYRPSAFDTANRMWLHLFPIALLLIAVRVGLTPKKNQAS